MQRAVTALRSDRLDEASRLVHQVLREDQSQAEAWHFLAGIRLRQQQPTEAAAALHKVMALNPGNREAGLELIGVLRGLDRDEERLALCRELVARWPDDGRVLRAMGLAGWELGDLEEATEAYRKALELDPTDPDTLCDLTLLGRSDLVSSDVLRAALRNPLLDWRRRARLHFALGKQAESAEQYAQAFEDFTEGNRIRRAHEDFGIARKLGNAGAFLRLFEESDRLNGCGCSSRRPVFVTGMPRSGTTLVAQILNTHPEIQNLGERLDLQTVISEWARRADLKGELLESLDQMEPDVWARMGEDYLARLPEPADGVRYLVDKMPFNVNLVGFLRLMFPEAAVIVCRRDLMDVGVSCFGTGFSETAFSYDLYELGQFIGMCDAMAGYWQQRWPDYVHVVDYEDLVTAPDAVVRGLFERIAVEWDEGWRSFHTTRSAVRTASISQVRRAIYQSSVGRWKRYESHLEPFRAGIADARKRLGNKSQAPG